MDIFTIQVIKYLMKYQKYYLNGVQVSGKSYFCSKLKKL